MVQNSQASSPSVHMVLRTDISFDHALEQLRNFNLLKALPESHKLWMHDLTRYIIQQSVLEDETTSWVWLALEVLFYTFPKKDGTANDRAIADSYLPQAESPIAQARNVDILLQKYAKLIVIYLFVSMSDFASVIERQGRLKAAEVLFEKCYKSQKLALYKSHQRTLAAAHYLALCFANQGRLETVVGLCQKTLSLSVDSYGADDPDTLRIASNIALFADHQGLLDESLPIYQESLTRYKKRYRYDHISTMRIRSNLAGICRELVIAVFKFVDPGHPVLFRMVDGLGILYRTCFYDNMELLKWYDPYTLVPAVRYLELRNRRLDQAMRYFELAKAGYVVVLGEKHSCIMIVQMNISRVQMELEKYDLTTKLVEHAKDGLMSTLGNEHPHVAVAQYYQGWIAAHRGNPREAQRHYINNIKLYTPTLGRLHPNCVRAAMELLKLQPQLHKEDDQSAVWAELIEEATPRLSFMKWAA
ncbi:hypothetical protein B7494_g2782 [Chlorociboria aeruginascens]|nr:hypothetical protein B7494_g2782 [Chlorociboria aeruginascens]